MTFVNHGCNGTFNTLHWMPYEAWVNGDEGTIVTEKNATVKDYEPYGKVYDICRDRHVAQEAVSYDVAARDIKAGEEILCNYIFFGHIYETALDLKSICSGDDVGDITKAEMADTHSLSEIPGSVSTEGSFNSPSVAVIGKSKNYFLCV